MNFTVIKTMSKQAVQQHGSWSAISNGTGCFNRTPESYFSSGFIREGWDG